MNLEELLKLWEAAKAKAEGAPNDKGLQADAAKAEKAYNDAKAIADAAAGGDPDPDGDGQEPDDSKLDAKTRKYLERLRKEAAGHRTKAKDLASKLKTSEEQKKAILKAAGIETDEEPPEEKIKKLTSETQAKDFRLAILEAAVKNGIPDSELEFFEFRVTKAAQALGEGEELSDEALAEIVKDCKSRTKGGKANTSVGNGANGKGAPKPGESDTITLGQFMNMGVIAKSKLYEKNPELYNELKSQMKAEKKRFV